MSFAIDFGGSFLQPEFAFPDSSITDRGNEDSGGGDSLPVMSPNIGSGGSSAINLSSLLGFGGGEELDGMGDLFRTLLALQGRQGGQNASNLFSGIEL